MHQITSTLAGQFRGYTLGGNRRRAASNIDRYARRTGRCAFIMPYRDTGAKYALYFYYTTTCPHLYHPKYHPTGTASFGH